MAWNDLTDFRNFENARDVHFRSFHELSDFWVFTHHVFESFFDETSCACELGVSERICFNSAAVREEFAIFATDAFSNDDSVSTCVNVRVKDSSDVVVFQVGVDGVEVDGDFWN